MPQRKRDSRRTNDPEGMRQKVLDAAEEAFQARGYHATSMGDLMAAAGVSGGALHHHYPTKKALGLAVIDERVRAAVIETWIAPVRTAATAWAGVHGVFTAVADALDRQGHVQGCPLNNLAHELSLADPDFRVALADVFGAWHEAIAERFADDQCEGREPVDADPEGFAALAIAVYSGAMSMAKATQDAAPLRLCLKQLESSK